MGVYLIGYDLHHRHIDDYVNLEDAIKTISDGNWWHCLDSTWLIVHPGPPTTIYNALAPHMHNTGLPNGDRLLVATMAKGATWSRSFPQDCQDWLLKNL
jgi:hypothetical protein